jgi:8-oxo-dGTP pyrophosphatase MutT (NUDIX family)
LNKAEISRALEAISTKLAHEQVRWALVGSANLALHGINVIPGDIDIISDRESAYRIGSLLRDSEVTPVTNAQSEDMRSYLGKYLIEGVEVEVMGDVWRKVGQEWTNISEWVLSEPARVRVGKVDLPCCPLEKELIAYEISGREGDDDKVRRIRAALRSQDQPDTPEPAINGTRAQCIVIRNGEVLFGHGKDHHFFIGGRLEDGETPEQAALRELTEEANVEGTILFRIDEPASPDRLSSAYSDHATFLVDIGQQMPILGCDPEEADSGDEITLAGLEMVPLSDIAAFTWIDIRYFASLVSECIRRNAVFPWMGGMNDLLRIWRVK